MKSLSSCPIKTENMNGPRKRRKLNSRDAFAACKEWVLKSGGQVHPSMKLDWDSGGIVRGLYATASIPKDTVILKIPQRCLLFVNTKWYPRLVAWKGEFRHPVADSALCLQVIEEMHFANVEEQDYSFHTPYIRTLPESEDFERSMPAWWSSEKQELLTGSPLLDTVRQQVCDLRADYETALSMLQEQGFLVRDFPCDFTFRDFMWGMTMVSSRAYKGIESTGDYMAPLLDLLNHKRPRQTSYALEEDSTSNNCDENMAVVVRSLIDLPGGEEIAATYGAKSNDLLLQRYGFIVPETERDIGNVEPDGSSNNIRVVCFSPSDATLNPGDAEDETWRRPTTDHWQVTEDGTPVIQKVAFRLASKESAPFYTYGPFSKALGWCRALTANHSVAIEEDLEEQDEGEFKESSRLRNKRKCAIELAALKLLTKVLEGEINRYPIRERSVGFNSGTPEWFAAEICLEELRILRFYTDVAFQATNILRIENVDARVAALRTLLSAPPLKCDKYRRGAFIPCSPSDVCALFFRISFGVS